MNKEAIEMALELDALALRAHAFGFGYEDEIFHPNWRNLVEEWVEVRGEIGNLQLFIRTLESMSTTSSPLDLKQKMNLETLFKNF